MKINFHTRRQLLFCVTYITLGSINPIVREGMPWINTPIGWDKLGYFVGALISGGMIFLTISFAVFFLHYYLAKIFWHAETKGPDFDVDELLYSLNLAVLAICALYWVFW